MAEIKHRVIPVLIEYQCDECKEGTLEKTGRTYPMSPPSFEYRCNKCAAINNFRETYPTIRYEKD